MKNRDEAFGDLFKELSEFSNPGEILASAAKLKSIVEAGAIEDRDVFWQQKTGLDFKEILHFCIVTGSVYNCDPVALSVAMEFGAILATHREEEKTDE